METKPPPPPPPTLTLSYEQIQQMVAAEFEIEEAVMEFNVPTFYMKELQNVSRAFERLYKKLNAQQLIPVLRKRGTRTSLQVVLKPPVKPSNPMINVVLLVVTIITTLVSGYLSSERAAELMPELMPNPWVGAVMFSVAVIAILGSHEMGHKLMANRHQIEATYPYFIPGLPPIGTFGAVIQEKSLPPSKNSLFDLGISGPVVGFVATAIVTVIGIQLSVLLPTVPTGGTEVPLPELFGIPLPFLFGIILTVFPPPGTGRVLWLHPVVQAGYIGMIVTMLNLMPIGQLDGGHVTHVLFGDRAKLILSFLALAALVLAGYYFMAILAFLIARARHPDPLDGVSKLSTGRKLAAILVLVIIVLSFDTLTLVFF